MSPLPLQLVHVPATVAPSNGDVPVYNSASSLYVPSSGIAAGTKYVQANATIAGTSISGTIASNVISLSVGPYITTAMASNRASDFVAASAAFAGTSASGTIASNGISVSIGPYITTAMASNGGSNFVQANATIAGTSISGTIASNGISLSVGPYLTTAMQSASSSVFARTGFTTTTAAGAVIAGTHNTDGLLLAVPGYLTTAMASDRASDFLAATATIAGTNVSGTIASNGISLSVDAAGGGLTNIRVSAGTTSNLLSALTFSNTNGVSFGINASTITASVAQPYVGWLEPYSQTNTAGSAVLESQWYVQPFVAPAQMSGGRINFLAINTSTAGIARNVTAAAFNSNTTGTKNQSYSFSIIAALWSQGAGGNSTRLESFWSNSFSFGLSNVVNVSISGTGSSVTVSDAWSFSYIQDIGSDGAYTLSQFATGGTSNSGTSMNTTALSAVAGSIRSVLSNSVIVPVGFNTTISAGNYWLGYGMGSSQSSAATNFAGTGGASALQFSMVSLIGVSCLDLGSSYRNFGSIATAGGKSGLIPRGGYSAVSAVVPQFIALSSDFNILAGQWAPYFNFNNRGLTK